MDALRNVYGDDQQDEALTHSPPAGSLLTGKNISNAVVEDELIEKAEVQMQPEVEMTSTSSFVQAEEQEVHKQPEIEMTPTSNFVPVEEQEVDVEVENGGASYIASDDDLSGEDQDVKIFAEGENEYSSDDEEDELPPKKQRQLSSLVPNGEAVEVEEESNSAIVVGLISVAKKSKKKYSCVWTKPAVRKGKKKVKPSSAGPTLALQTEDAALVTPMPNLLERCDDSPDMTICLSKVYKAGKVDISEDRMSAGSTKGYRMVRATRGIMEGAWYFEIKVIHLGESGHTRLGWSTEKGDLQAPVGYDAYSYGYKDVDGEKVHKGIREKYGAGGYKEGDVIGFYINLPDGEMYAPKQSQVVLFRGQKYLRAPEEKHDILPVVPGSCISFFKNGICQGIAYKNISGGLYYPAASMYTLPNQQNCAVKFNFGPDFECFPSNFGECTVPKPIVEVSYHGYDKRVEPNSDSVKGNDAMNNP
ncbi:unnamed protein product [Rhodiola kirilowii]